MGFKTKLYDNVYEGNVSFNLGEIYGVKNNKVNKSDYISVNKRSFEMHLNHYQHSTAYIKIIFIAGGKYIPSYITLNHKSNSAVIFTSEPLLEHTIDSLKNIHKNIFLDNNFNTKIIDLSSIFNSFYTKHNVEYENYNQNNLAIRNTYIVRYINSNASFYIKHSVSYNFDLQNFIEKLSVTLSNTLELYNNYDKLTSILNNINNIQKSNYLYTRTGLTFLETDIKNFITNYRFYDNDFYRIFSNITDDEVNDFIKELSNISSENLPITLTIKGLKFSVKNNRIEINIPLVTNFISALDRFLEAKIAYAWLRKFDKLDKIYGFINKARVMSL